MEVFLRGKAEKDLIEQEEMESLAAAEEDDEDNDDVECLTSTEKTDDLNTESNNINAKEGSSTSEESVRTNSNTKQSVEEIGT